MGHYEFNKDLQEAQTVEKQAVSHIQLYFPNTQNLKIVSIKEYDIECEIEGKKTLFEVKNELMVQKTGNVAIEFQSRGEKSGLAATKSDYWVEKIRDSFFIIPTNELRQRIANAEYDIVKTGGDYGSATMFYLVKEEKFKSWCKEMTSKS